MQTIKAALFDFDGTLRKGDSILPYLLYAVKCGMAPKRQVFAAIAGYLRQKIDPKQVVHAKEMTLSFIQGRPQEEMDAFARRFVQNRLMKGMFADGLHEIDTLRKQGMKIIVVSASPDVYMRVLPEFLPVDAVIATPCTVDEAGCYTGRIARNCRREEKPKMIEAWLHTQELALDMAASEAYGDTAGDVPMLKLVGHANLVNPKGKLRWLMPGAKVRSWR